MTKLLYTGIEQNLIYHLSLAKKSINVAVAWFTNPKLHDIIQAKREEGVIIHLLMSDDQSNYIDPNVDFQKLINYGVVLRITKSPRFMHNKFCIIDDKVVISGSYNWTVKAEKYNFENVIISEDKKLIQQFQTYFDNLKFESQQVSQINQISFSKYEEEVEPINKKDNTNSIAKFTFKPKSATDEKYPEELINIIDKAELLYLETKIKECVNFAKTKLLEYPETPELYLILTQCYWRLELWKEMISSAEKTLSINEKIIEANNFIGIGFSKAKGKREEALKYFDNCLKVKPGQHELLINRGRCYDDLTLDYYRNKEKSNYYRNRANEDFESIIKTFNNVSEQLDYSQRYSYAIAQLYLEKYSSALKNIGRALIQIREEPDIWKRDMNDYAVMKELQYNIKAKLKSKKTIS